MIDEEGRITDYLSLIDGGQRIEVYPEIEGIERNDFEYVDFNSTHLKVRNRATKTTYYVPFVMIEFINPAPKPGGAAVLRLRRKMLVRGASFV